MPIQIMNLHPIVQQSFDIIDHEIGEHDFTDREYAVVQRVIHSTADFEFQHLIHFSPGVIDQAIRSLREGTPIVTDVTMVRQGIINLVRQTFGNPVMCAVSQAQSASHHQTRTEIGLRRCLAKYPTAIYIIGNAPTALLALCQHLQSQIRPAVIGTPPMSPDRPMPAFIIGAPVGFVSVLESKAALSQTPVPHIRVEGRKGGSAVAAAILNALLILAWRYHDSPGLG